MIKKTIFLIVIFLATISVSSQNKTNFLLNYWVKSNDNKFVFSINKISNDSLYLNHFGYHYKGKILHTENSIITNLTEVGKDENPTVNLTFFTDNRKGTGTVLLLGTDSKGNKDTPKPIELFDNKFKFAITNWVADNKKYINKKFTITKITADSLFVNFGSLVYSGRLGRVSNDIESKLYEVGNITNNPTPTIMTIYTKKQRPNSGEMNTRGYISIKNHGKYGSTYYITKSTRKKELAKMKKEQDAIDTKRINNIEQERLYKVELQRKRNLLTKNQIDKVQKDVLKLATLTKELIGKYKEIKRYGRYASHSMIKSYKEVFLKWKSLYNNPNFERRPEHMTAEQYRGINNYADVLFAQHHNKAFNKILDSNY